MPWLTPEEKRTKRCFHRVISGLEKGGKLRLVTLTSSNEAKRPIQADFRRLIMRLRRRGLLTDYIRVVEVKDDWREHIHMCFRGKYIDQAFLSYLWEEVHQSPVVDIRAVKTGKRNKRGVANYLAKYMAKELVKRYSWSHWWVYPGFCKVWKEAKSLWRLAAFWLGHELSFFNFLLLWRTHLQSRSPPQRFLNFLTANVELAQKKATAVVMP